MNNNNMTQQKQKSMMNLVTTAATTATTAPSNLAKAEQLKCPRCDSSNTKFCYYNNYSLSQPRHFCESCKRYWTRGGTLRNVPVGGSCRKNKRIKRQNANAIKLSNPDPILSSIANPNAPLNQLPASSSAHLSSLLYGDVNLSSFSPTISPQLINGPNLTFFRDNHYSSFGSPLKQLKVEEYNQPMFPCEDPQQANSEIWQYNYPFEALNAASDSSYLNWTSAMGSVSGWHDAPNSSIAPLF